MMLKRSTTESKPKISARLVRAGLAGLAAVGTLAALATGGCLDRPLCTTECQPTTNNVFVDQIVQTSVDKIDLLFMVDNSVSMADKQEILKEAVPVLVNRLIQPICVDDAGKPVSPPESANATTGNCTNGSAEFNPIGDIHIGILSSSLGAHGGVVCSAAQSPQDTLDDKAHLIGSMRPGVFEVGQTWNGSGFLAWDQNGKKNVPAGTNDPTALVTTFQNMIAATGEHGCGYEASMESWYRFLVDPEPPAAVTKVGNDTVRGSKLQQDGTKLVLGADGRPVCDGCDEALLAQRRAFLRPDSLVAIIVLSDENDCSIRDDGYGWFVGANQRMPRSTAACAANPNDPCCRSCASGEGAPPAGCSAIAADEVCKATPTWDVAHDSLNLRCYKQHQRFGFDLLYETQRYVNALKNTQINLQSTGLLVTNPLYDATGTDKAPRDPSLVFLAGIVGVPWQDIATAETLPPTAGLTYMTAAQLRDAGRWTALLGDPAASPPTLPTDPFMVETTGNPAEGNGAAPRSGNNPFTNDPIVASDSKNPKASPINGHEQNVPDLADLQYACTFPLTTAKKCAPGDAACDCSPDKNMNSDAVTAANSPLCQGGADINTQTSAKAYPGARHLQVLKDFGDNAIVASICPKFTTTQTTKAGDPNYGYNPAVGAIIERLKEALAGKCLPRALTLDADKRVACKVIEAQKNNCNCSGDIGRAETDPAILGAVQKQLKSTGNCATDDPDCKSWCTCEIVQATGGDLDLCRQNGTPSKPTYCYISKDGLDPAGLTNKCPSNQPQLLRFAEAGGVKTPAQGSVSFIACLGAPVGAGTAGGPTM